MKIAYYMPFKPLGHPNPSGDLVFGTELFNHLNQAGNQCRLASRLRCRWIYLHPSKILRLLIERRRVLAELSADRPDLWLSYHCYYKAPDLLGPWCARKLKIPYLIFQGIYSTKRRRQFKTMPGFYLNRQALLAARLIFTNKLRDHHNLLRLLPEDRVLYVAPGIHTKDFAFDPAARDQLRTQWQINDETVILSAAMFRPGVKTSGLKQVIRSCAELSGAGHRLKLVIAGDGACRGELETMGHNLLGTNVLFLGRVDRDLLNRVYSSADIFAFPGIEESLGMVYLEAQSCGVPVVAYQDWGGAEAAIHGKTGLLSPASEPKQFTEHIRTLIEDPSLRRALGAHGAQHVRSRHELASSYSLLNSTLQSLVK